MASLLATCLVGGMVPIAAAAPAPAPAADAGADLAAKAAAAAQEAVAKGLDKGPGPKAPKGAPYPAQQAALAAAAAVRQNGPLLGSKDLEPAEVVGARTATSRTTIDPTTGTLTTQFSGESLNFKDAAGKWQPIGTDLVPAGKNADGSSGWVNGDNRFDAAFPASLAKGPVVITDGIDKTKSVSLRLLAASPDLISKPTSIAASSASDTSSSTASPAASPADSATRASPSSSASSSASPARAAAVEQSATTAASTVTSSVGTTSGVAKGDKVTYADAAGEGFDVGYAADADAVKETLTLDSPSAVTALAARGGSVSFALELGKGLTPKLSDTTPDAPGGEQVTITDAKGGTAFLIPAAFMDDAKGVHSDAVTYTLTRSEETTGAAGWTLTLTPDADWLAAKDRAYPVVVDPTIEYLSPILGCVLKSAKPTTAGCSSGYLPVSNDSANNTVERSLLRFDDLLNVVPADSTVLAANLKVNVQGSAGSPSAATSMDVQELTAPFTNAATWNTRNGSTNWTTPGGDVASLISARRQMTPGGGYQDIDVAELVSRWVEGTSAYNGFVLSKTTAVSGGGLVLLASPTSGNSPSLYLEYSPLVGQRKADDAIANIDVTDRTSVSVNPATGNAAVATTELNLSGVGLDLRFAHTSNSLATGRLGPYGYGWGSSVGGAGGVSVRITDAPGNHVQYTDGNGARWTYYRAIDGSYTRPAGLDVDLTRDATADTWTLTDRASKVAQTFTKISTSTGLQNFYGLAKVVDRNGNQITYTYDASATVPYLGVRILRSVTDTRGRTVNITNPGSFATATTDSSNRSVYYTVASNLLTEYKDANGNITKYAYDSANRVTRITSSEGRIVTLAYDSLGRVTQLVNSDGTSDSSGNPTGPTWTFAYNSYTRSSTGSATTTTTVTDPRGNNWTYVSDGRGRVGQTTNPLSKTTSATYTSNDDAATQTAATPASGGSAANISSTYNSGSWTLASTRVPTGAGISYSYGTGARLYDVTSSTNARGTQTTYGYDANGNLMTSTTGGITTTKLYQGSTDPQYGGTVNCGPIVNGVTTATKVGVLCEVRDGAYVAGSSASSTTAHRTLYQYNALGEMVSTTPPSPSAQTQQTYVYDSLSRITQIKDGKGQTTIFGYDALDRQTYVMHPDSSSESYYITADGPLRSHTEYNSAGTATRYTEYQRDALSRVVKVVSPEGNTTLSYDGLGLLRTYDDGAGTVTYDYNNAAQLISLAEPGGSCTGQTYNNPGAATTQCLLFQLNDDGRRTAVRYPGGQTLTTLLDSAGRTAQTVGKTSPDNGQTTTTRLDLSLSYTDPAAPSNGSNPNKDTGLVFSVTDALTASKTSYSYDALDQLTVANAAPTTGGTTTDYEAFCYDGSGNRTKYYTASGATCTTANPAITYSYDGAGEMTDAVPGSGAPSLSGTAFSYDANGNQTAAKSAIGRTVTYSDRDAATGTTPAGASPIPSSYARGGNQERLMAGATTFRTSLLSPAPASSSTSGNTIWTIRDPRGELLALRVGASGNPAGATSYYPFTDQANAVRLLVKADGTVANSYTYSAYGVTRSATEAFTNPFRYGGGYTDLATGLIKLGARFYDPTLGRFTQMDPSGQDMNAYSYCASSPINCSDTDGLRARKVSYKPASFKLPSKRQILAYGVGQLTSKVVGTYVGYSVFGYGASAGGALGTLVEPGGGTIVGAAIGGAATSYVAGGCIGGIAGDGAQQLVLGKRLPRSQWGRSCLNGLKPYPYGLLP